MSIKTYGWLGPERLKFINDNPKVVSLLYDLGLLPEEISARIRGYVEEERKRCADLVCKHDPTHPKLKCCRTRKAILDSEGRP